MDKVSERLRLEVLLGFKLTRLEGEILAQAIKEQPVYQPQVKRDMYDILQSLGDRLRMV